MLKKVINLIKLLSVIFFSTKLLCMNVENAIEKLLKSSDNKELAFNLVKYLEKNISPQEQDKIKKSLIKEILTNEKVADMFDYSIGKLISQQIKVDAEIKGATFSPNGKYLAINTDSSFSLFDISQAMARKFYYTRGSKSVESMAFSSDSNLFLLLYDGSNLFVIDLYQFNPANGLKYWAQPTRFKDAVAAGFTNDNKVIVSTKRNIMALALKDDKQFQLVDKVSFDIADFSDKGKVSLNGNMVFVHGLSQVFAKLKNDKFLVQRFQSFPPFGSIFESSCLSSFSPDSKYLVNVSFRNNDEVYYLAQIREVNMDFKELSSIKFDSISNFNSIAISKANDFLAIVRPDRIRVVSIICLYDISDKEHPKKVGEIDIPIRGFIVFSPDGRYFAIASCDKFVIDNWLEYRLKLLQISDLLLIKYLAESDDFNKLLENHLFRSEFIPSVNQNLISYFAQQITQKFLTNDLAKTVRSYC